MYEVHSIEYWDEYRRLGEEIIGLRKENKKLKKDFKELNDYCRGLEENLIYLWRYPKKINEEITC